MFDFADSDLLRAGDEVIAIGYPLDVQMPRDLTLDRVIVPNEASVNRGLISAFRYDSVRDTQLVQTDVAMNPGNSGGPLFTLDGQVVAMNTWGLNHPTIEGLNFSVLENTIQEKLRIWAEGPTSPVRLRRGNPYPTTTTTSLGSTPCRTSEATDDEFQITATFVNPPTPFSYGFRFGDRNTDDTDDDPFMYFIVDSDKEWSLWLYRPDSEDKWTRTISGSVPHMLTGRGSKNTLRLLVDGRYGALAVNGRPVDLNDEPISPHVDLGGEHNVTAHGGRVALGTGMFRGTGKDSATKVEDVTATSSTGQ